MWGLPGGTVSVEDDSPRGGSRRTAHAFVIAASVVWGTSFPLMEVVTDVMDPIFLTPLRLLLAAAASLLIAAALGTLTRETYLSKPPVLLSLSNALGFLLQHVGIALSTASKGALLVNINVVFVAVMSVFLLRERLGAAKVSGVVAGLLGITLLTTRLDPAALAGEEALGDLFILLGGLAWAVYIVLTKRYLDRGLDLTTLTVGVLGWTAVLTLPLFAVSTLPVALAGEYWLAVVYLSVVCSAFALFLWILGLRGTTATVASVLLFVEVLTGVLLAVVFLGESFGLVESFGGLLILAALFLAGTSGENAATPR